jgi:hypothetical protein
MRWFKKSKPDPDVEWAQQSAAIAAARVDRESALVGQEALVSQVEALLFRHDPIGINFEDNTDEYRAEAQTIVIRMPEASSVEDLRAIVHQEFVRWFDAQIAGPPERYSTIAAEIWALRTESGPD